MELKDRVVIVSEKNMEALASLYGNCSIDELERIVNNIIGNAVEEIREDEGRECMKRLHKEIRQDDMGKIEVNGATETSPEWCPLRCKR